MFMNIEDGRHYNDDEDMDVEINDDRTIDRREIPAKKRQRLIEPSQPEQQQSSLSLTTTTTTTSMNVLNNKTDCYDDIMNGYFGMTTPSGDLCLLDDWFTVHHTEEETTATTTSADQTIPSTETSTVADLTTTTTTIRSLTQQLTAIKRLLWPAAEECAKVVMETTAVDEDEENEYDYDEWRFATTTTPQKEFVEARSLANPMEVLGESRRGQGLNHRLFMNRSAIKMANIDREVDIVARSIWLYPVIDGGDGGRGDTQCNDKYVHSLIFADLCGAPGGFSEYIINRFQSYVATGKLPPSAMCRGYGMSLTGTNEHGSGAKWKLDNLRRGNICYHICNGADGTGDIYNWDNVLAFQKHVEVDLHNKSVDSGINLSRIQLVLADGGFDKQRDHECQEQIAQKMVLCEMAAALEILSPHGILVVKMFGFQTPVIRLAMKSLFERFEDTWCCLKPVSSRPASSERYVVFSKYVGRRDDWRGGNDWINSIMMETSLQYNRVMIGPSSFRPPEVYANFENELDQNDLKNLKLNLMACNAILGILRRKTAILEKQGRNYWGKESDTVELELEVPTVPIQLYRRFFQLDQIIACRDLL
jgi:cap1 methyltransferase